MKVAIFLFAISSFVAVHAIPLKPPSELYSGLGGMTPGHRGYFPFIGHYNFRVIADHIIDQTVESFDPDLVKPGDFIYINVWYLPWFEKNVHDKIQHPYILLSGDVGRWLPDPKTIKKLLYDPKCATWMCRNMLLSYHPKLLQMPMGQDLALFGHPVDQLEVAAANKPFIKKHLLSMNFLPRPWGDRDRIVKLFEHVPYCFTRLRSGQQYFPVTREIFYEDMAASQFILSPIGLEWDCVRTWESWIFDCIPIVEHSFTDPVYDGLPTVFVNDWTEINEQFLADQYEKLKGYSTEKAYFDYWLKKLREIQNRIRMGDLSFAQLDATRFNNEDFQDLSSIILAHTKRKNFSLICKGFLSTLRPLQLLRHMPTMDAFYLRDPWMNSENLNLITKYTPDKDLLKRAKKLIVLGSEESFTNTVKKGSAKVIFFDLSYQRHSLLRDFNDFRHHLKHDLQKICAMLKPGKLVCGNMAHYPYVKEQLDKLAKEHGHSIQYKGNFWFFTIR